MKSIEEAIWSQNAPEVAQALASGWRLPLIQGGGGAGADLTLPLRVVMRGWVEGWLLLRQAFPELLVNTTLFSVALRHARHGIVTDFLEHGMDANEPNESGQTAVHHVMAELSTNLGDPIPDEDFILTLRTLQAHGANLSEPYPGEFYPRANTLAGHTAWSWVVLIERLDIANSIMPVSPDDLLAQPRALESLASLVSSLVRPSQAAADNRSFWLECCNLYGQSLWTQIEGEYFPVGADLGVWQPEDWSVLTLSTRKALWQRWAVQDEFGMTPLHQFLLHDHVDQLRPTLHQIFLDEGECITAWGLPDEDGVRPCDLWAILLRQPRPDQPMPWPVLSFSEVHPS